jgi:hypothetical protein
MPQVIAHTIAIRDTITETLTFGDAAAVQVQANGDVSFSFANGTTAGAQDLHWENTYTLAAGASQTITLSALTDGLTRTVALARVKRLAVLISAKTGNDYLTVGNATTNPWLAIQGGTAPTFIVRRYELKIADDATGFVVVAGSSDQLKLTNSGAASMTISVKISGCSA